MAFFFGFPIKSFKHVTFWLFILQKQNYKTLVTVLTKPSTIKRTQNNKNIYCFIFSCFIFFEDNGIKRSIFAQIVHDFYLIFSHLHQVYTLAKIGQKGGLLGQTNFLCKMSRKSLTCANFRVIICRVIRA